jgi:ParB-like chromosome segregation protein Spo0J
MKAAIDLLSLADTGKVAILGDMFELGENASALHGEVGKYAAEAGIDRILCVGEESVHMYEAARTVLEKKMSVREVEKYVKELSEKPIVKKPAKEKDPMITDLENRLSGKLGTKVGVSGRSLTIHFTDTDDLNRILDILGCIEDEN